MGDHQIFFAQKTLYPKSLLNLHPVKMTIAYTLQHAVLPQHFIPKNHCGSFQIKGLLNYFG